jgi:hypothetical protein
MLRSVELLDPGTAATLDDGKKRAAAGYTQLAASVILLSSAWPLTKIALSLGSTPLWFAEGRAVLSGVTIAVILTLRGRLRVPRREDLPALLAVGVCQLGLYFAFAHEAVAWVAAGRTAILANTTTIWVVPLSLIFLRERIPHGRLGLATLDQFLLENRLIGVTPLEIVKANINFCVGHHDVLRHMRQEAVTYHFLHQLRRHFFPCLGIEFAGRDSRRQGQERKDEIQLPEVQLEQTNQTNQDEINAEHQEAEIFI